MKSIGSLFLFFVLIAQAQAAHIGFVEVSGVVMESGWIHLPSGVEADHKLGDSGRDPSKNQLNLLGEVDLYGGIYGCCVDTFSISSDLGLFDFTLSILGGTEDQQVKVFTWGDGVDYSGVLNSNSEPLVFSALTNINIVLYGKQGVTQYLAEFNLLPSLVPVPASLHLFFFALSALVIGASRKNKRLSRV
ncbi:hypothetical protein H6785_02570 [Candidatus Nomurabacteria bacterium]|nr:hypothetical protein [Candidatus Kaiserbacteria bacterium]MCB9815433.1 hypothetical protein [Candidatus Nomurabacteria bacterium]